jgi:hypothetical protein
MNFFVACEQWAMTMGQGENAPLWAIYSLNLILFAQSSPCSLT